PTEFAGEAAKGTSGVVDTVANGSNTIGYADASQAGELGVAQIQVGDAFYGPTAEAAAALVDASPKVEGRGDHDWALELDRQAEGAYPVALVSYVLVCETYQDPATAELVKAYVSYIASPEGQQQSAAAAGSAPLSSTMSTNVQAALDSVS
ncbi:MAG: substrate-binding domain-containing protein, partial [Propioniciclava sp.]